MDELKRVIGRMNDPRSGWQTLPMELWQQIAQYLSPVELVNLSCANRRLYDAFIDTAYHRCIHFDMHGWKPLWHALHGRHLGAVKRALKQGADPNQQMPELDDTTTWLTPLVKALRSPAGGIVDLLLQYGADPYSSSGMSTPISMCIAAGDVDNIRLLLSHDKIMSNESSDTINSHQNRQHIGGLVNFRDPRGYTPLHCAAFYPSREVILELVRQGARVDARDAHGLTPLLTAAQDGVPDNIQTLLEAGADPTLVDYKGWGIVDHAVHICHKQFDRGATLALAAAVVYGSTSEGSWCNLSEAQLHHHLLRTEAGQIKGLAALGANVDAKSQNGVTALWMKCGQKVEPELMHRLQMTVEALIDAGADVNFASPKDGMTPLMQAAHAGQEGIVSLLRRRGADVTAVDHKGETALSYATRSGPHSSVYNLVVWTNEIKRKASDTDGKS